MHSAIVRRSGPTRATDEQERSPLRQPFDRRLKESATTFAAPAEVPGTGVSCSILITVASDALSLSTASRSTVARPAPASFTSE